jgi:hypothetical protein
LGEALDLDGKFTLLNEKSESIGFTSDGSEIVLRQDNVLAGSLPDLVRRPYVPVPAVSLESMKRAKTMVARGNEYLGFGCLGCNQITISSPEKARRKCD